MTWAETYYNTPGSVENYLDWAGGLEEGFRGSPVGKESVASIEITGTEVIMARLDKFGRDVPELVMQELQLWCEDILSASRKEVPWDTTLLLESGTIEESGDGVGYIIGYNTAYAARQHEDMTFHHPKPGTKAKYLEDPAMRISPLIAPGIVQAINSYFAQGVPNMSGMSSQGRSRLGNLGGRFI